MPTMKELDNFKVKSDFIGEVKKYAQTAETPINLNKGLRTTEELLEKVKLGDQVPFPYERILSELEKYE